MMNIRKMIKKGVLGILLLFVFVTLEPLTAKAEETVDVSTEEEWLAIADGESRVTYKLTSDIEVSELLTISSEKNIVIDLNGYTVSGTKSMITNEGKLTIQDSSNMADGKLFIDVKDIDEGAMITNIGEIILMSGTIEAQLTRSGSSEVNIDFRIVDNQNNLEMQGGNIIGKSTITSNDITQKFICINNSSSTSYMWVNGGKISTSSYIDAFSEGNYAQTEVYGILYHTDSVLHFFEASIEGIHECAADFKENVFGAMAMSFDKWGVSLKNSEVNISFKSSSDNITGAVVGIGCKGEADPSMAGAQVSATVQGLSEVAAVGILVEGYGTINLCEQYASDAYNEITTSSDTGLDIAIISMDKAPVYVDRAIVSGSIGIYCTDGQIVLSDISGEEIDSERAIIKGTLASIVGNAEVWMYGGTLMGNVGDEIMFYINEGTTLVQEQDGDIVKYYLIETRILIEQFVTRLYQVCLNREPDAAGKTNWVRQLQSGSITGVQAAYGFIFSKEFKGKNYCNEDYVKQLYRAFMGREADSRGLANWVNQLNSGKTREEIFNGFALSGEFNKLCAQYGIVRGNGIGIPKYGTVPTGSCSACGEEDGVTAFVKRLYNICLNRNADSTGLKNWTGQLWNHTASGSSVAYGFIFSKEFTGRNYSNADYVEYLYKAFLGRNSDAKGKAGWVNKLNSGMTRKQVFDGFVGSQEFTGICNRYGILRG